MGGLLSVVRPSHPAPLGSHPLGSLRARLPAADGQPRGLLAQVHYPGDLLSPKVKDSFSWFREEVIQEIARNYKVSLKALRLLLAHGRQLDPTVEPKRGLEGSGWPMVVFSSGIWGSCEMYTQFCRDIASCGFIVVAIEHEDGSGIYAESASTQEMIGYVKPPKEGDLVSFRHPFLERHADELEATAQSLRRGHEGVEAVGDLGPQEAVLARVLRCGDPSRVLLVGHSMGASGIVRYLGRLRSGKNQESLYCGALLLDLWGGVLTDSDLEASQLPFALLISEAWHKSGVPACERFVAASGPRFLGAAVVRGTTHQWVSDSIFFLPARLLRKMGMMGSGDPKHTLRTTGRVVQCALEALLDAEGVGAGLAAKIAELEPDTVVPLELKGKDTSLARF